MEVKDFFPTSFFHFAWRSRRHVSLVFPLCLVFAAILHLGAIFLFDIVYGKGGSANPRLGELVVLLPGSPEYKKIAAWLEGNDPSLLYTEYDPDAQEKALRMDYRPTFDLAATPLLSIPAQRMDKVVSDVFLPRDIIASLSSETDAPSDTTRTTLLPTRVEFSETLEAATPLPPPPVTAQSAEATTFLIGVLPDGRIGYILPQKDSSLTSLDREASRYLQTLQLKETPRNKVRWGSVTFHWGMPPKGEKP